MSSENDLSPNKEDINDKVTDSPKTTFNNVRNYTIENVSFSIKQG